MLLEYPGSQSRLRLLNKLFGSDLKLESALRACSSAWLERIPDKDEAGGSSPPRPTKNGGLAQLGERLPCKQEVSGSTPLSSTIVERLESLFRRFLSFHFCSLITHFSDFLDERPEISVEGFSGLTVKLQVKQKGHKADALAPGSEEGRGQLR